MDNLWVCPRCDHHGRISADQRLKILMDEGFAILPQPEVKEDPLKFRDSKRYIERLKLAREKSKSVDAFSTASGQIKGYSAVVGVQDFNFMGGSMGMAVGAAFVAGAEEAIKEVLLT